MVSGLLNHVLQVNLYDLKEKKKIRQKSTSIANVNDYKSNWFGSPPIFPFVNTVTFEETYQYSQ